MYRCFPPLVFVTYLAMAASTAAAPTAHVLYSTTFSNGIDKRLNLQEPTSESISVTREPGTSEKMLRVSIQRSDNFSHVANGVPRAEVNFGQVCRFRSQTLYRIDWSTLLPTGYVFDNQQPEGITQIHAGVPKGVPPFSLSLIDGHYVVDIRHANAAGEHRDLGDASTDRGAKVSWTLLYRPSPSGQNATTELFKDGRSVLTVDGLPNAYPNDDNGYFKIGIYKWWWTVKPTDVDERTVYFGDVVIQTL